MTLFWCVGDGCNIGEIEVIATVSKTFFDVALNIVDMSRQKYNAKRFGSWLPDAGTDSRVNVDKLLGTCILQDEIGEEVLAQIEIDFCSGLRRLNADWSFH